MRRTARNNQDGHDHNRSFNYGTEGPTDDAGINLVRERQKRNFLATLFFSHGVPMLLAGDEFGRSQMGNNNGYCQDSEVSWFHWQDLPDSANELREFTARLIALRQSQPLLRRESWRDGIAITWLNPTGGEQTDEHWDDEEARQSDCACRVTNWVMKRTGMTCCSFPTHTMAR